MHNLQIATLLHHKSFQIFKKIINSTICQHLHATFNIRKLGKLADTLQQYENIHKQESEKSCQIIFDGKGVDQIIRDLEIRMGTLSYIYYEGTAALAKIIIIFKLKYLEQKRNRQQAYIEYDTRIGMSGYTEKINSKMYCFLEYSMCIVTSSNLLYKNIVFYPAVQADLIEYMFIIVTNCNFLETDYPAVLTSTNYKRSNTVS